MSEERKPQADMLEEGDELTEDQAKMVATICQYLDGKSWNFARLCLEDEGIPHTVESHHLMLKGLTCKFLARLMMMHHDHGEFQDDANEVMEHAIRIATTNAQALSDDGVSVPDWLLDDPKLEHQTTTETEVQDAVEELIKDIKVLHKSTTTIH